MDTMFVTITGVNHYYGLKPFKIGGIVKLLKDRDNEYDSDAIEVRLPYVETVGYVANSPNTCFKGTVSAGRLYDKIDEYVYARIMFVTHSSVIALVLGNQANAVCDKMFGSDDDGDDAGDNDVIYF